MREIISVKNLYKLYRVGDSVVRALDGVSFFSVRGRILCDRRNVRFRKIDSFEYACRTGKTDSRGSDRSGEAYRADEKKMNL